MQFDVINAHHKLIRKVSTSAVHTNGLTKQSTFRLNATVTNLTCLDLFVWKSFSKGRGDLFVSWIISESIPSNWRSCFLGDGRWRQVIRRCASVADTGVTGVCNWGVYDNGIYWEECYCAEDACNKSHGTEMSIKLLSGTLLLMLVMKLLQS